MHIDDSSTAHFIVCGSDSRRLRYIYNYDGSFKSEYLIDKKLAKCPEEPVSFVLDKDGTVLFVYPDGLSGNYYLVKWKNGKRKTLKCGTWSILKMMNDNDIFPMLKYAYCKILRDDKAGQLYIIYLSDGDHSGNVDCVVRPVNEI